MRDSTVRVLSRLHTVLYRTSKGLIGRRLPGVGAPMLLLTTVGRKSGEQRTVPLLYLPEGDGYAVIASYGGRPHHPDWYLNLMATPQASVQVEGRVEDVVAVDAGPEERPRLWQRALDAHGGYADYEARTDRVIPIVLLTPSR